MGFVANGEDCVDHGCEMTGLCFDYENKRVVAEVCVGTVEHAEVWDIGDHDAF